MGDSISSVALAKLTGDNRKWIYRNRMAIPGLIRDGAVERGRGNGLRFRNGKDLDQWVTRRITDKFKQSASSPARRVSSTADAVVDGIKNGELYLATVSDSFLKMAKRAKRGNSSLPMELRRIANNLNHVANEIEK